MIKSILNNYKIQDLLKITRQQRVTGLKCFFDLLTQATSRNLLKVVNQLMIILADANTLDGDDTDKLDFFSSHVTGLIRHDIKEFAKNHSRFTPENRNLQEKTEYLASLNAKITGTFIAPEVWM